MMNMNKFFFVTLIICLTINPLLAENQTLKDIQLLAEQGNSNAQFRLGNIYLQGKETEKNPIKALDWYTKAADQGHSTDRKSVV